MRRKPERTLMCAALCVCLDGPFALAQPAPEPSTQASLTEAKMAAKAAANRGQAHFDAGQYEQALTAFQEANQAFPAPTIKLMIARCYTRLGRLLAAGEIYRAINEEPLPHYAPPLFFEAQAEAKMELDTLLEHAPTLQVEVRGASGLQVALSVDGMPIVPGEPMLLDPGLHTLIASAPARESATQQITLHEGDSAEVTLTLRPVRASKHDAPQKQVKARGIVTEAPSPIDRRIPSETPRGRTVFTVAAFGTAGAGLVFGAVMGGLAARKAASLEQECPGHRCYDGFGGDTYDSMQSLATASTIGFAVGSAAAVVGVTALLWPQSTPQRAQLRFELGPVSASFHGVF